MSITLPANEGPQLASWLKARSTPPRVRGRRHRAHSDAGLRFAFYGRTSTGRQQDPETSREWQRDDAVRVIDGHGRIVVEFFDVATPAACPGTTGHKPLLCCAPPRDPIARSTP
ncbi:hypothetical protein ACIA5C_20210 [Actinoplanes sp. NPDC051343]|uniref:hypothetical protein n=1 Tax=Actinoplanes sp. NPDC051343 TaxID=3363906 RepID=UPI0037AA8352